MDCIAIEKLKVFAHHGVFDFEKQKGQFFYVDAYMYCNFVRASLVDNLDMTVSYAEVCDYIEKYMNDNTFDLIETVADRLAIAILNRYPTIKKTIVRVHKPDAPISQETSDIYVEVCRERHTAFIAYGSNEGDSKSIIQSGKDALNGSERIKVISDSGIFRSTPYGVTDQNDFLNGVIEIETYYEPFDLLDELHRVENELGRKRLRHWGPRTLDLDIVLYDNIIVNSNDLTIPHSDMANRDFVLKPMAKLAPSLIHPVLGKSMKQLLEAVSEKHVTD